MNHANFCRVYSTWFGRLALLLIAPVLVSGCCAPESCYVAMSRFEKLDPVIAQILLFEDQEGRLPESLEEAFPDGLPEGIEPLKGDEGFYRFAQEDGNFPTFSYGRESPTGGRKDEITLHFRYVGGGLIAGMNDCFWTATRRSWTCYGHI